MVGQMIVHILSMKFAPTNLTVKVGDRVDWHNQDALVHTVTSDIKTRLAFDSGDIQPGQIWSYVFNMPGTYTYSCAHHSAMRGEIVVEKQ